MAKSPHIASRFARAVAASRSEARLPAADRTSAGVVSLDANLDHAQPSGA